MDFLKKFFRKNASKTIHTNPNQGQTFILEQILTPSAMGLDGGDEIPSLDPELEIDLAPTDSEEIDLPDNTDNFGEEPPDVGDVDGGEVEFDPATEKEVPYITSLPTGDDADIKGDQTVRGEESIIQYRIETDEIQPDGEKQPLAAASVRSIEPEGYAEALEPTDNTETQSPDAGEEILNTTEEENENLVSALEISPPNFTFDSGVFTVGESGEVGVDFLFDGGGYKGELAIFSLDGMDEFEPGSEEFIQEAARRALSDSVEGHVVISDAEEGARFSGNLGERDQNDGEYLGVKTFNMRSGDTFGVMLVPNKTVARVLDNPSIGGSGRPLFSMVTANPDDAFHIGQIADVTGDGNTFVMEDIRVDGKTDSDYNDVIFQVRGAEGKAALLDSAIASDKEWRYSDLGQALLEYAKPYITPESVETEVSDLIQDVQGLTDALQDAVEALEPEVIEPAETPTEPTPEPETPTSEQPVQPPDTEETETAADSEQDAQNSDTEETETAADSEQDAQNSDTGEPETAADSKQDAQNSDTGEPETAADSKQDAQNSDTGEPETAADSEQDAQNSDTGEPETAANSEQDAQNSDTEESEDIDSEPEEPSATDNLIARLDHLTTRLEDAQDAPVSTEEAEQLQTLVQQVETLTETLEEPDYQSLSERAELAVTRVVERLENVAQRIVPIGETPPEFEFVQTAQPLVGIIDTGFSEDNPDIDYARITLGQDHIDNDNNPLLSEGEGNEHGTHILGIIGATENNDIGIDGINDQAPLWVSRAVGSGKWAESLVEFVDAARESEQPNAVVNLSMDLTQIDAQGNVTTRYEFTPLEMAALEYARQNNVLVVAAAGNDGGVMSALGQASQQFDNLLTIGAAEKLNGKTSVWKGFDRAEYSSYGEGLDLVADTGTLENPVMSTVGDSVGFMRGTSVATAKVTGAASQVWAANPDLTYRQVVEIIKSTTTDLNEVNPDAETGSGLLNLAAAIHLAQVTKKEEYIPELQVVPTTWSGEGIFTPMERPVRYRYEMKQDETLWGIAQRELGNGARWTEITKDAAGTTPFTSAEASQLPVGQVVYLPGNDPNPQPEPEPEPEATPEEHKEAQLKTFMSAFGTLESQSWLNFLKEMFEKFLKNPNGTLNSQAQKQGTGNPSTPKPLTAHQNAKTLAGKKILLDPGHGKTDTGFDPGAVGHGTTEATENLHQANLVANHLRQLGAEVTVLDEALSLAQIGQRAAGHDIFVSLHQNAFNKTAQGHEVFSHPNAPAKDKELAQAINSELDAIFPDSVIPNRGTKTANFSVLRNAPTSVPAVLVESMFIDAPGMSRANVETAATAVARGIEKFFTGQATGSPKPVNPNPPEPDPSPTPPRKGVVNSKVGSWPLNFRASSYVGATILGQLAKGSSLEILESVSGGSYNPGTGSRNDWYKVKVNGKTGYVAAYYVDVTSSSEPNDPPGFRATDPFTGWVGPSIGVALRNSPKHSDKSGLAEPYKKTLTFDGWMYGESVTDIWTGQSDALWYRYWLDGKAYWVPSAYINGYPSPKPPIQPGGSNPANKPGYVNTSYGLNFRTSPSASAPRIGTLLNGTNLTILEKVTGSAYQPGNRTDWYKVKVGNQEGYVAAYYVKEGSKNSGGNPQGMYQNPEAFYAFAKNKVGITRLDGLYNLRGQCVTLIARYIQEVFLSGSQRTASRAFGHGKDTARRVAEMFPNYFSPVTSSGLPKRGAVISFPDIGIVNGIRYGHVGIVMESSQLNNGQRQVRIIDSNGDSKGVNSTVKEYSYWINLPSSSGYGSNIYWTNPK